MVDATVFETEVLTGRAGSNPVGGTASSFKGTQMATAKDQMKTIKDELDRVRVEIERLRLEEGVLSRLLAKINGEAEPVPLPRKRATNVKPLIIDIINRAAGKGATSSEVAALVQSAIPGVAKESVGSILSRLKSDGAFVYVGERYYERQFAPTDVSHLRAVN